MIERELSLKDLVPPPGYSNWQTYLDEHLLNRGDLATSHLKSAVHAAAWRVAKELELGSTCVIISRKNILFSFTKGSSLFVGPIPIKEVYKTCAPYNLIKELVKRYL